MKLFERLFGKSNKTAKKAQKYLDTLSSPTSNTPSSRFSNLGSYFTGKGTRQRKSRGRKRRGTRRRRRH
jgi:hypothetical protein